jgi:hypothetical protein
MRNANGETERTDAALEASGFKKTYLGVHQPMAQAHLKSLRLMREAINRPLLANKKSAK